MPRGCCAAAYAGEDQESFDIRRIHGRSAAVDSGFLSGGQSRTGISRLHIEKGREERRNPRAPYPVAPKAKVPADDILTGKVSSRRPGAARVVKADGNGDGVVDRAERSAWNVINGDSLDTNLDAQIDAREEQDAVGQGYLRAESGPAAAYDTNGDGWLVPSESKDFLRSRFHIIQTNRTVKVITALEAQYDANHDGSIEGAEAEALRRYVQ